MIQPYLFMDELEQIDINIKNKIIGWALKQGKQIDFVLATKKSKKEEEDYLPSMW